MILIDITEEEADILFTGLTNSVDEMKGEIDRLTKIETAFDRIRNKLRKKQNETNINTDIIIDYDSMSSI